MHNLNKDQLDGLAKLCFDLARGALALSLIPSFIQSEELVITVGRMFIGLVWGLVFIKIALLLLKVKKETKE